MHVSNALRVAVEAAVEAATEATEVAVVGDVAQAEVVPMVLHKSSALTIQLPSLLCLKIMGKRD
jgi:hypothetical protein